MNLPRCTLLLVALGMLSICPRAFCQSMKGTTLGQSQNDDRDLMNSLIVDRNKPKIDKGEKKEEVDPKKLPSKKSNDTTFSGSLNDIGLDWRSKTMGKPHVAGEKETEPAKAGSTADRDLKVAKTAEAAADGTSKEQDAGSSKSDEKPAEKAKASTSKTDGDH